MKIVYSGLESSGKSLMLSKMALKLMKRNGMWWKILRKKKIGVPSTMAFNMPMSDEFIAEVEKRGLIYLEWKNFEDIEHLRNADIFIDEVLKIFPSRGGDALPAHEMDFLTQGAKSGNHIIGTSQDFSQVHKQFRLITNKVYVVRKLFGSPRPMDRRPPVKDVYGVCIKRGVKPESFRGDNASMETEFIPIPFFIRKKDTLRYNTMYKVPRAELPPLRVRKQRVYWVDDEGKEQTLKVQYK